MLLQYYFGRILSAMGMYTVLFTATATLGLRIWAYLVGQLWLKSWVGRPALVLASRCLPALWALPELCEFRGVALSGKLAQP